MPFAALFIGIALIVVGVQNTQQQFFSLLKNDVSGFVPWFVSITAIGALGYIKAIRPITDAFLVLLIVVLFLSNGGFFTKLFGSATSISAGSIGGDLGGIIGSTLGNPSGLIVPSLGGE